MSFSSFPVSNQRAPKAPIEIVNGKKFQVCPLCTKLGLKTRLSSRSSYVRHYRRKHLPADNLPSTPAYKFVFYEHSTDAESGGSDSNSHDSDGEDVEEEEEDGDDGSECSVSVADSGCANESTDDDADDDNHDNDGEENDNSNSNNDDTSHSGSHHEESSESSGYMGFSYGNTGSYYSGYGYQYGFSSGW
ncbi:hypothetical protein H4R35_000792 [Dimargaris xerosporica]|nr:hypothetical protein H4R35_000792 [Dimargaris xerosporica]